MDKGPALAETLGPVMNSTHDEHSSPRPGWPWLVVALVLGLARFWRLGEWSLWYDESLTLGDADAGGLLHGWSYAAISAVAGIVGEPFTEWGLRLLPALAGYLSIPAAYLAFRPLVGGQRAGILAVLIAASVWQQFWSQTGRGYTLAQLWMLLGFAVWIRAWMQRNGPLCLAAIGLVAVGTRFHPQVALLAACLPFGALVSADRKDPAQRRALLWMWGGGAVVGLAALPLLWGALKGFWIANPAGDPPPSCTWRSPRSGSCRSRLC
ncbi:MAG: glycosyltransferase family 39 protein [Planctomycetota bacterium]